MHAFKPILYAALLLATASSVAQTSRMASVMAGNIPALCELALSSGETDEARKLFKVEAKETAIPFLELLRVTAYARQQLLGPGYITSTEDQMGLRANIDLETKGRLHGFPRRLRLHVFDQPLRPEITIQLGRACFWDRAHVPEKALLMSYPEFREHYFEIAKMDSSTSFGSTSANRHDGSRVYVARHLYHKKNSLQLEIGIDVPRENVELYLHDHNVSRDSGRLVHTKFGQFCRVPILRFGQP